MGAVKELTGDDIVSYEWLGVHKGGGEFDYVFRVMDSRADGVEVTGDFNSWGALPMKNIGNGIWEAVIKSEISLDGTCYKYRIFIGDECILAPDPLSRYAQWGDRGASIMYFEEYSWRDGDWIDMQKKRGKAFPMNIYQLHLGSWRAREGKIYSEREGHLNYRDVAAELAGYISDMGYTHICLLPITEEGKLFAPTSLHGRPDDLKFLVDTMHRSGIGVILQLSAFDGDSMALLGMSALFWLAEFHMDGICLSGETCDTERVFDRIKREYPYAITICAGCTDNKSSVDLFCDDKWGEIVFDFALCEPKFKKYKFGALNRSLGEGFNANALLSVSAEDVSNGKRTLYNKMQGGYDEKFARLRLFFSYMMMHPGKKMTFMGCELGANREWRDCEAMEWFLLDCDANSGLRKYVRCLGRAYVSSTALWELDGSWRGFKWLLPLEAEEGLLAFERLSSDGDGVIAVMNFADKEEKRFAMELEDDEKIVSSSLVNSDKIEYGGKGRGGLQKSEEDGRLCFDVPPLSAIMVSFKK